MSRNVRTLGLLSLVLSLGGLACDPSPDDEAKMKQKMELETKRAELMITHAKDCPTLEKELVAFGTANKDAWKSLSGWWGGLGDGPKDKLIEKHQAAWDKQSVAMIGASGCAQALEAGVKALE